MSVISSIFIADSGVRMSLVGLRAGRSNDVAHQPKALDVPMPDAGRGICALIVQRGNKAGIFRKTVDDANNGGAKLTLFRCAPGGGRREIGANPRGFARNRTHQANAMSAVKGIESALAASSTHGIVT
jgi:hypothetical protein